MLDIVNITKDEAWIISDECTHLFQYFLSAHQLSASILQQYLLVYSKLHQVSKMEFFVKVVMKNINSITVEILILQVNFGWNWNQSESFSTS